MLNKNKHFALTQKLITCQMTEEQMHKFVFSIYERAQLSHWENSVIKRSREIASEARVWDTDKVTRLL